ncbi:Hpt domain-containing protein [uncultured Massilia sp.]|uniref:Hpt domain-containing protein n=1 Tax=uncultured Massilia sp. TaxID=169973 RepID=UPI0025F64F3D|nr:Hpt domain-containing protein [uncultured Massilia sp.]
MSYAPIPGRFSHAMLCDAADQDPALVAELLDVFLRTTPGRVARLRAGVAARRAAAVAQEAHGLKSTLALLGATDASAMCDQAERLARRTGACPDPATGARLFALLDLAMDDAARCRDHHRALAGDMP